MGPDVTANLEAAYEERVRDRERLLVLMGWADRPRPGQPHY